MKRSLAMTLVLVAGLVGAVACGKSTPTSPRPFHSALRTTAAGYMPRWGQDWTVRTSMGSKFRRTFTVFTCNSGCLRRTIRDQK